MWEKTHGLVGALDRNMKNKPGAVVLQFFPVWTQSECELVLRICLVGIVETIHAAESAGITTRLAFSLWILPPAVKRISGLHGPYLR